MHKRINQLKIMCLFNKFLKLEILSKNIRSKIVNILSKQHNKNFSLDFFDKKLKIDLKRTKEFLSHDNNLLVTRADKGNSTVVIENQNMWKKLIYSRIQNTIVSSIKTLFPHWKKILTLLLTLSYRDPSLGEKVTILLYTIIVKASSKINLQFFFFKSIDKY